MLLLCWRKAAMRRNDQLCSHTAVDFSLVYPGEKYTIEKPSFRRETLLYPEKVTPGKIPSRSWFNILGKRNALKVLCVRCLFREFDHEIWMCRAVNNMKSESKTKRTVRFAIKFGYRRVYPENSWIFD